MKVNITQKPGKGHRIYIEEERAGKLTWADLKMLMWWTEKG